MLTFYYAPEGTGLDTPVKSGSRADRQWDTWKENQPITSDLPACLRGVCRGAGYRNAQRSELLAEHFTLSAAAASR